MQYFFLKKVLLKYTLIKIHKQKCCVSYLGAVVFYSRGSIQSRLASSPVRLPPGKDPQQQLTHTDKRRRLGSALCPAGTGSHFLLRKKSHARLPLMRIPPQSTSPSTGTSGCGRWIETKRGDSRRRKRQDAGSPPVKAPVPTSSSPRSDWGRLPAPAAGDGQAGNNAGGVSNSASA